MIRPSWNPDFSDAGVYGFPGWLAASDTALCGEDGLRSSHRFCLARDRRWQDRDPRRLREIHRNDARPVSFGAWGVESSDVAQFTEHDRQRQGTVDFPYPFPSNLAQPGSQAFQFSYNMHYKDPFVQQWNLTIERDLGFQTGLRLSLRRQPRKGFGLLQRSDASAGQHNRLRQGKGQPLSDLVRHQQLHNRRRQRLSRLTAALNKRCREGCSSTSATTTRNLADIGGY